MPRQVEETLLGVRFQVREVESQSLGPDGQPLWNGKGEPKTEQGWVIDFLDQSPNELRIVRVPLSKDARDKLVEALTGGITVARAGDMPRGPIEL